MLPPGTTRLLKTSVFRFDPGIPDVEYRPGERAEGVVLSSFRTGDNATHVLVVNLDYKTERTAALAAPAPLESFDATTGKWSPCNAARVELRRPGGGGKLVRIAGKH